LLEKKVLANLDNNGYVQKTLAYILYNLRKIEQGKSYFEKLSKINLNLPEILTEKEITA
jgi:hypothetical protein